MVFFGSSTLTPTGGLARVSWLNMLHKVFKSSGRTLACLQGNAWYNAVLKRTPESLAVCLLKIEGQSKSL